MRVDPWLSKKFVPGREGYNCWAFSREIWLELTGKNLGNQTPARRDPQEYKNKAEEFSQKLQRLESPAEPCLVLFQRPRLEPHIGVYYKGKVLHLTQSGAYYMPLHEVSLGYLSVSFYR
jgi:hypothetical protein